MNTATMIYAIVLDAGPILKNEPPVDSLLARSERLITVPSILTEIKDQKARSRVETLLRPFLVLRSPRPQSLQFVISFAKKSGDFSVLSRADLELLALTYELDCERNGGDGRLRKAPGQMSPGTVENEKSEGSSSDVSNRPLTLSTEDTPRGSQTDMVVEQHEDQQPIGIGELSDELRDIKLEQYLDETSTTTYQVERPFRPPTDQVPELEDDKSYSDNTEGWITPSNLHKHQTKHLQGSPPKISNEPRIQIACITTDFAMQNVLLQIGLNLLSPSLQRIRNIKTYILRCHACFQQVKDTSKQFCPRCGKPTLTRVSCSTNQKGDFRIHLKKNMQWNHRGDRYSIPKPVSGSASGKVGQGKGGGKGGWGKALILAEDQKEYQRVIGKESSVKAKDLMEEDYLPGILTGDRGRSGGRPKIGAGRNVNARRVR